MQPVRYSGRTGQRGYGPEGRTHIGQKHYSADSGRCAVAETQLAGPSECAGPLTAGVYWMTGPTGIPTCLLIGPPAAPVVRTGADNGTVHGQD
ncbi:MAG: hypothetical protein KatS3mg054_0150 [Chloroflexus sp.]|nr:MAG: hypothetical protein KatS3mg054_0150 [Chloroflexus sp.]